VLGATHSHVDETWHDYLGKRHPVSVEDADTRLTENDPALGRDYAIMRFQDKSAEAFWSGTDQDEPNVLSYARDARLKFTGFTPLSAVQVGWVVCAAGSGYTPRPGEAFVDSGAGAGYVPGIHCGEITSKGNTISARICARKGDSGGPLFTEADGKVLGILSGGDSRSGACVAGDNETNFYAPISTILDRVNARTAGAYDFTMAPVPGRQLSPAPGPNVTRRP
jgi:streptogrisin C